MNDLTIPYEFLNGIPTANDAQDQQFRTLIEQQLAKLSKGHQDITGAAVALEPIAQGESPYLYRGRVVCYVRPENIAGVAKHETPEGAVRNALRAVERQIREQRTKLRQHN